MYIKGRYIVDDKMVSLLKDNYFFLPIMTRFGIELGFGDKTIGEVCEQNNVDITTFLAVINLMLRQEDNSYTPSLEGVSVDGVLKFLQTSHMFYIKYRFPSIRKKLERVMGEDKISKLIIQYFDDYVLQINKHLGYEDNILFPYITALIGGEIKEGYSIEVYSKNHDHIDEPLAEFKDLIIKYYSGPESEAVIDIIHDLLSCSKDVARHNIVEDRLLVPLIRKIEMEVKK